MTEIRRTQVATPTTPGRVGAPTPAAPTATTRAGSPAPIRAATSQATTQAATGASGLVIPDWVKDAVFYQVFPERFENGDVGNDPVGTAPWGSPPTNEGMMGGDLQGITKRMGYLTQLGVNALYMNPIFAAPSNHKYNTTDYEHVDPAFGGDAAFKQMTDAAHKNGVKIMLDGVFNHVSHQHKWFKDVRDKGPKSEHFDKFTVNNWPIKYEYDAEGVLRSKDYKSWWNYATLPVLKTDHPDVREYFLHGKDSVVKRWIRDGKVDGWRMDVADDPNFTPDFWRAARREIKSVNPDAYMVAENWKDANAEGKDMLRGDQFDGTMNYQYFTWPSVDFFGKKSINADEFVKRLQNDYSKEAKFGEFNILDSHDTPRFITQAGGDWYRQRPAAIFQMTYVGAPVIYYGDELGMEGGKDPDSRRAMDWALVPGNQSKNERGGSSFVTAQNGAKLAAKGRAEQLFTLYQTLIKTRKEVPALRRGDFQVVKTDNAQNLISYRRAVAGDARDAVVTINNDVVGRDDVVVPMGEFAKDGTRYTDSLSGTSYVVDGGVVTLPHLDGNFGSVLVREA